MFDLARNKYLEYAHSEWILALDCDERMYERDLIRIKKVTDEDKDSNGFLYLHFSIMVMDNMLFSLFQGCIENKKEFLWRREGTYAVFV